MGTLHERMVEASKTAGVQGHQDDHVAVHRRLRSPHTDKKHLVSKSVAMVNSPAGFALRAEFGLTTGTRRSCNEFREAGI
jgi:hypothetical protein